jgi:hypothetical protein
MKLKDLIERCEEILDSDAMGEPLDWDETEEVLKRLKQLKKIRSARERQSMNAQ